MVITPSISIYAPSSAEVGISFQVYGYVRENGERMVGVAVNIYVDGSLVTSTTTDSNGYYSRNIYISTLGSHTLKATSIGASMSRSIYVTYTPSVFSVTISAPSSVNAGVTFTVSGVVKDQYGYGMGGLTVNLYKGDAWFGSRFTASDGSYSASTSIASAGTYTLKATCTFGGVTKQATRSIEAVAVPPPPVPPPPVPPPPPTPPPAPPPEVPVYEVRFACIPSVGGVKCTLDGMVKYSNAAGISSFFNISQGAHSYSIMAPAGWRFVSGNDVFQRPLYESGTTVIEWVPYPETPWPEDQPWMLMFVFEKVPVSPPPTPPPEAPPPPPGAPVATVTLQARPNTQQYDQPIAFSGSVSVDGIPESGLTVEIRDASTNKLITITETDDIGNYYIEWTPTYDRIGSFKVWTLAKINPEYYSNPVTIIVTEVAVPPPPVIPPTPPPKVPPTLPPDFKYMEDRFEAIYYVLWDIKEEIRPITIKANTYKLRSINLSIARSAFDAFYTPGFALTVLKCTGTMDMIIGDKATDSITIDPILYPQMLVIDRMDFEKFYVKNSAQPGKTATIIVWRRE